MNKKEGIPLIKKVFFCLMTMIIVIISVSIPSLAIQPYYNNISCNFNINPISNYLFLTETDNYIKNLQEQNYKIAFKEFDLEEIKSQNIIKDIASSDNKSDFIKNIINIKIYATKITINKEIFYFKNSTDALNFVTELNKQIKTEYSINENIEIDINQITSNNILNKKIEDAKNKKQEMEQRQREQELNESKSFKVTTRSGSNRIEHLSKNNLLKSYVYISSYYGERWGRMHNGIDFAAAAGTPIYAWKSGKITYCGWSGGYGNFVEISHSDGTKSRYAHLSGYNCSLGETVSIGDTIGYVGTTGNSTGNHLHFEIKINGEFVNPLNYL